MVPFFFLLLISAVNGGAIFPTKLVDEICTRTSDYSSCVNSLYSDPRTPDADQYTLAYIAVGLAYHYAVDTRDMASQLPANTTDRHRQECVADYDKAVSKLEMASNDLDSETFFELEALSVKASESADRCQKFATRNKEFKGLCDIVGAVGKLFSGRIIS